jgi:molybdenum cofactor guanylyltransferase
MVTAGVVLVGGRSSRMGTAKAALPWHGTTLLARTAGVLLRATDGPVLVVRAPGQPLPSLPAHVEVHDDPVEGRGPLQGIATGLAALTGRAEVAFVAATDLPLLHPAYVRAVLAALDADHDVALPHVAGHRQTLAAAYRVALAALTASLVGGSDGRPPSLFARCRVRTLTAADLLADPALAAADPSLDSLRNVNDPEAYAEALGLPPPRVQVTTGGGVREVRAATVAGALAAADLPGDAPVRLDGALAAPDVPLAAGDVLAVHPAGGRPPA